MGNSEPAARLADVDLGEAVELRKYAKSLFFSSSLQRKNVLDTQVRPGVFNIEGGCEARKNTFEVPSLNYQCQPPHQ